MSSSPRTPRSRLSAGNKVEDEKLLSKFPKSFDNTKHTTLHWLLCSWQNPVNSELVTGKLYVVGDKGSDQCQMIYFLGHGDTHKQNFDARSIESLHKDTYMGGLHLGLVFHCNKKPEKHIVSEDSQENATSSEKLFVMTKHDSMIQNEVIEQEEGDSPSGHEGGKNKFLVYAFYKIVDRKGEIQRLSEFCSLEETSNGHFERKK